MDDRTRAKRAAGRSAAETVADGQVVGLGSGSTAAHAITALGERVADSHSITGVPTSWQARQRAHEAGIDVKSLDVASPDVAIDGADQVAPDGIIKGGGGAHVREKIVDADADRLVIVIDPSKETDCLDRAVPVAVVPAARRTVGDAIEALGGDPDLREAARRDGPVRTDEGGIVIDAAFGAIDDPAGLAAQLDRIPGVIGHGLFVDLADAIHCGHPDGSVTVTERETGDSRR